MDQINENNFRKITATEFDAFINAHECNINVFHNLTNISFLVLRKIRYNKGEKASIKKVIAVHEAVRTLNEKPKFTQAFILGKSKTIVFDLELKVSELIKKYCETNTQISIAKSCKVSPTIISCLAKMSAKRKRVSLKTLFKIIKFLTGFETSYFFIQKTDKHAAK